ncbi:MAG: efflux RND transporter permease subunit [Pseudomonadota bacterium]
MSWIKLSQQNAFATVVAFLIVVILGATTLINMPIQLMPNIERPTITIINSWRSAAPEEMESEIVEPQEDILKTIVGVERISTSVRNGLALTTIEFSIDENMQQAYINVINALNQVQGMPREANEPMAMLGEFQAGTATMMIQKVGQDKSKDFTAYQELIKHTVGPRLRAIPGVSNVSLLSYLDNQLQIIFDPYKLAALGITVPQLMNQVMESKDFSGGFAEVGRREYSVRYEGQFKLEEMTQMVVAHNDGRPVYLGEVATIVRGYEKQQNFIYRNDNPAFYITLDAAKNANTVEIFEQLKVIIAELNEQELNPRGLDMALSFDSSLHIKRAVNLVKGNLGIGIALALLMLYMMIRGVRSTLLISITIPVSLSAAIFAPVAFMGGVEGQMFFDLALTMTIAVFTSMMTALLLLPVVGGMVLKANTQFNKPLPIWAKIASIYHRLCRSRRQAWIWFLLLSAGSVFSILALAPKTDFLPEAKFEGIIAVIQTPPGTNYTTLENELAKELIARLKPYQTGVKAPVIKDFNLTMSSGGRAIFIYPEDPSKAEELLNIVRNELFADLPDTRGVAFKMSLLNTVKVGSGRSVYLDFTGKLDDTTELVIERTIAQVRDRIPGSYVRRVPNAQSVQTELNIRPNNYAIANSGLSRNQVGQMIRSMTDGQYLGQYFDGNVRSDVILKTDPWHTPEQLAAMPVYTPNSGIQTIDQLTTQTRTVAANRIRRLNGQRALTIGVTPPDDVSLEEAIAVLAELKLEAQEQLGAGMNRQSYPCS